MPTLASRSVSSRSATQTAIMETWLNFGGVGPTCASLGWTRACVWQITTPHCARRNATHAHHLSMSAVQHGVSAIKGQKSTGGYRQRMRTEDEV